MCHQQDADLPGSTVRVAIAELPVEVRIAGQVALQKLAAANDLAAAGLEPARRLRLSGRLSSAIRSDDRVGTIRMFWQGGKRGRVRR